MTINTNARLDESAYLVQASAIGALTTTVGDTTYVSMKNYARAQVIIDVTNASTVTGGTVTLKQATAVAGTSEKALAFTRMLANTDYAASKAMTETAVTSNTFTTQTTNSKDSLYIIEVDSQDLDSANNFDCIRVDGTGHAATNSRGCVVLYNLFGARYNGANPLID